MIRKRREFASFVQKKRARTESKKDEFESRSKSSSVKERKL